MTHSAIRRLLLYAAAPLLVAACSGHNEQPQRLNGEAQGTYYTISYCDPQHRNLQRDIDSLLKAFDQTASLWVDNSLLRRVNRNEDSVVNALFADLLAKSNEMNRLTEGRFDCTVGKLVNAWGFGHKTRKQVDDALIDSLLQYTGQPVEAVQNSDGQWVVSKPMKETEIDFNAIAQGYSVDLVGQHLESLGIVDYLINIGGEVLARGCKPDGSSWVVGIERPADNRYSTPEVETAIELKDCSVVTSGNYRKYYEHNGVRYSHTIDPRTGRPVEHTLLSVSVIDTCAWRADALATAMMVMGLDEALRFAAAHPDDSGMQALFFIYDENGEYRTYASEAFKAMIKQ